MMEKEIEVGEYVKFKNGEIDEIKDIRDTISGRKLIGFKKSNSLISGIGFENSVLKHETNIIEILNKRRLYKWIRSNRN